MSMPFFKPQVFDRGIPNSERILLRLSDTCELGMYFVGIGMFRDAESVDPINDNCFWLGRGYLTANDLVLVYTGGGSPTTHEIPNQDGKMFSLFWGRSKVMFQSPEIAPYIYKVEGALLEPRTEMAVALGQSD